ncbi:CsxC family protein [Pseudalkalibacillus caeni]|uniref:DUF3794 domain-containing protein n=1 Tax=Exobacillus caeni TaxID=2574798 RepID=A0A5R9F366_9BACL|nr:DUF3794 domain-containing protein [Pseudalkalibacillus caeni]TLS37461.1 DUF3794 domain-containing protein [Pseudalkalibacillus caeni]
MGNYSKGKLVKIPVVLLEDSFSFDVSANITLPEPALEIKAVTNKVKVTQCLLLLPSNKLWIKGFVRKNIQFATPIKGSDEAILSSIKSFTLDVPFDDTFTITNFKNKPVFHHGKQNNVFTYQRETEIDHLPGFSSKDKLLSGDLTQFDQESFEFFNELPFCELVCSRVVEYDEALNRKMGIIESHKDCKMEGPFEEGTFTKFIEKMDVDLVIKVLQNQQVDLGKMCPQPHPHPHPHPHPKPRPPKKVKTNHPLWSHFKDC